MNFSFINLASQYASYKKDIDAAIQAVLDSGVYINGPAVSQFEHELTEYIGCKASVGCASGTDALLMALMALGIQPGDEVITPSFTFVSTAEVVRLIGAIPIFADVEYDTALVNADTIEAVITPRTKAIIPVSLFGQCPEMGPITQLAQEHQLPVIEDAAQSFGAIQVNRRSGAMSPLACTSFFPAKPLGCYGDGGAIFVNDEQYLNPLLQIRNHGQSAQYKYERVGINGRLDAIQAAILSVKLKHYEEECRMRQEIAERYTQELCPQVQPLELLASNQSVWAQYTIRTQKRDQLQKHLSQAGIPSAVYYPLPLHLQPAYRETAGFPKLEHTERLAHEVLSLPMSPFLQPHHQSQVIETVHNFF